MVIHAKTTEAKKKEELKGIQDTLINQLGASVLTYAEMDLLTQEIEKFREWLNQQWDLENINASFEYDPKS